MSDEFDQSQPPKGPGIFFDMKKGDHYRKVIRMKRINKRINPQTPQASSATTTAAAAAALITTTQSTPHIRNPTDAINLNSANPTILRKHEQQLQNSYQPHLAMLTPSQSQKLFTPHEYMHYTTRINTSKSSYFNTLNQLGYTNLAPLEDKPFHNIINKTQGLLKASYSLKYLGVIQGNMGILSKRLNITEPGSPRKSPQPQLPARQEYEQSHLPAVTTHPPAIQINNNNRQYPEQIPQQNSSPQPEQQQQLIQQTRTPKQTNKPHSPGNPQQLIFEQPPEYVGNDLMNAYLITQYSLPNRLKPIMKQKDPSHEFEKQRLERWHADQLMQNPSYSLAHSQGNNNQNNMNSVPMKHPDAFSQELTCRPNIASMKQTRHLKKAATIAGATAASSRKTPREPQSTNQNPTQQIQYQQQQQQQQHLQVENNQNYYSYFNEAQESMANQAKKKQLPTLSYSRLITNLAERKNSTTFSPTNLSANDSKLNALRNHASANPNALESKETTTNPNSISDVKATMLQRFDNISNSISKNRKTKNVRQS